MSHNLDFIHKYLPPRDSSFKETLLLFHGTGGDEESMISIGEMVSNGCGLLSPRGRILENGMPRFFKRIREGVFDLEDLKLRTSELIEFIQRASIEYGFDLNNINALGYSNGANIAASIILSSPGTIKKAALFHPMIPFIPERLPDLTGTRILITAGTNDPIVNPEETKGLIDLLKDSGAGVEILWHQNGHSLTHEEIERAKLFFKSF